MTASLLDRKRLNAARVLVVGDIMLDRYWFGDVDRISPEAPVPIVRVSSSDERLGGAANVARNVSALGARGGVLGLVGDDDAGKSVLKLLGPAGIAPHLLADAKLATTVKLRVIGRHQQMVRIDFEKQPDGEVLSAVLDRYVELLPHYDLVIVSDYGKGGLTHVARMIEIARAARKPVLIDPKGDDYSRYKGANVITPNRAELREVVGRWRSEEDLSDRVRKLIDDLEIDALLLTRSEEGMTLFTPEQAWSIPAQAREVFDVSGAGDTVIAVLGAMLAAGLSLRDSVPVANRAGGIVVGKLGTATVTYDELFAQGT